MFLDRSGSNEAMATLCSLINICSVMNPASKILFWSCDDILTIICVAILNRAGTVYCNIKHKSAIEKGQHFKHFIETERIVFVGGKGKARDTCAPYDLILVPRDKYSMLVHELLTRYEGLAYDYATDTELLRRQKKAEFVDGKKKSSR